MNFSSAEIQIMDQIAQPRAYLSPIPWPPRASSAVRPDECCLHRTDDAVRLPADQDHS